MIDFFVEVIVPTFLSLALTAVLIMAGFETAAQWQCSSYSAYAPTKVMALECYVNDGDRWVTLSSYVNRHNLNIEDQK